MMIFVALLNVGDDRTNTVLCYDIQYGQYLQYAYDISGYSNMATTMAMFSGTFVERNHDFEFDEIRF